jgi:hypothetical protein
VLIGAIAVSAAPTWTGTLEKLASYTLAPTTRVPTASPTLTPTTRSEREIGGQNTSNCHCSGCTNEYQSITADTTAFQCAHSCYDAGRHECKATLFDIHHQALPLNETHPNYMPICYHYKGAPTSLQSTGDARFSCWKPDLADGWYIDIDNGYVPAQSGRKGGWSCDAVCEANSLVCDSTKLDGLANNDDLTLAAFKDANFNCPNGLNKDCEAENNCQLWGAPYIHNTHINDAGNSKTSSLGINGTCYAGSAPNPAPCSQVPVDAQHRRLCPCKVNSSST